MAGRPEYSLILQTIEELVELFTMAETNAASVPKGSLVLVTGVNG